MGWWLNLSDAISLLLSAAVVFFAGQWSSKASRCVGNDEYVFRCAVILVLCLQVKLSVLKDGWGEGGGGYVFWGIQTAIFLCVATMAAYLYPVGQRSTATSSPTRAASARRRWAPNSAAAAPPISAPSKAVPKKPERPREKSPTAVKDKQKQWQKRDRRDAAVADDRFSASFTFNDLPEFPSSDEDVPIKSTAPLSTGVASPFSALGDLDDNVFAGVDDRLLEQDQKSSSLSQRRQDGYAMSDTLEKTLQSLALPSAIRNLAEVVTDIGRGVTSVGVDQSPFQGLAGVAAGSKLRVGDSNNVDCRVYSAGTSGGAGQNKQVVKYGEGDAGDIPFSVEDAAKVPCGVWIKDGKKEWRVVDRRHKKLKVKDTKVYPPEQNFAINDDSLGEDYGGVGSFGTKVHNSGAAGNEPFDSHGSGGGMKSGLGGHEADQSEDGNQPGPQRPDIDREMLKIEKDEYAHIRFKRHRRKSELERAGGRGYAQGGTAERTTTENAGGSLAESVLDYICPTQTGERQQEEEKTSVEAHAKLDAASSGQLNASYTGSVAGSFGLGAHVEVTADGTQRCSRWLTFLTGLTLMIIGGICHHLIMLIDWEAVWTDVWAYIFGIFAWFTAAGGSVYAYRETGMSYLMCLLAMLAAGYLGYLVTVHCFGYERSLKMDTHASMGASMGAKATSEVATHRPSPPAPTDNQIKEHFRVTYVVDLTESEWRRFQKQHKETSFRPVAPRLAHTLQI